MRDDIQKQAEQIRTSMDNVCGNLPDDKAVKNLMLFLPWEADVAYVVGDRRREADKLYKCIQAHTSQTGWEPSKVPALWTAINTGHDGSIDDPIPASRGMEYEYGKYYLDPEDGKTYLCKRGSETGTIILQYLPHELIGHYFEEA